MLAVAGMTTACLGFSSVTRMENLGVRPSDLESFHGQLRSAISDLGLLNRHLVFLRG
jgi:hypothetical protein